MDIQEIEVTIDKNGQVNLHVRGVKGTACLDLTRGLEQALGNEVVLREMTPEAGENIQIPVQPSLHIKGQKGSFKG